MRKKTLVLLAALAVVTVAWPAHAQQTSPSLVTSYDHLADVILAANAAEESLVRSVLAEHYGAAEAAYKAGDFAKAAAQMALFANEGDNAAGGIRKRLLEGGHHHNAAGEQQGIYEPGYVVVDRKSKKAALDASAALRRAGSDADRQAAWDAFAEAARPLLKM